MWFGSSTGIRKLETIPALDRQLHIGSDNMSSVNVISDLGFYFDSELNMKAHISRTSRACFFHLRRLRAIRNRLGQEVTARLVSAFVLSRLDYCNALLAGLPMSTLAPLQKVLNAAAQLVMNLKPRDHVTSALRLLHWLPIQQRIEYKLCLLGHNALNGCAPGYFTELLTAVADIPSRASLRNASKHCLDAPRTKLKMGTGPSQSLHHRPTTVSTLI
jgi:hypothetical protein